MLLSDVDQLVVEEADFIRQPFVLFLEAADLLVDLLNVLILLMGVVRDIVVGLMHFVKGLC